MHRQVAYLLTLFLSMFLQETVGATASNQDTAPSVQGRGPDWGGISVANASDKEKLPASGPSFKSSGATWDGIPVAGCKKQEDDTRSEDSDVDRGGKDQRDLEPGNPQGDLHQNQQNNPTPKSKL